MESFYDNRNGKLAGYFNAIQNTSGQCNYLVASMFM